MAISARWLHKEKVLRRLREMPPKVKTELRDAFKKGADDLVSTMRARAPHRTGALRATIISRFGNSGKVKFAMGAGGESSDLSVVVSAGGQVNGHDVRYAHLVEFGTAPHEQGGEFAGTMHPGTPARPFFFVTYRQKRRSLRAARRRAFRKAVAAGA